MKRKLLLLLPFVLLLTTLVGQKTSVTATAPIISWVGIFRGIIGIISILAIAILFSKNRKAINWKTVGIGLAIQLFLGITILKGEAIGFDFGAYRFDFGFIGATFDGVGNMFIKILSYTKAGSHFLLGDLMDSSSYGFIFAFQVLPVIIFFSALTSVLFYLGIIQFIVKGFAFLMTRAMGISGPESLSVAGNIFLGQTESPLMIKAYLKQMTKSEILVVMVGGMATVAGSVLGAYIDFLGGDSLEAKREFARHLLTASVMAAPGAILISKILYPETKKITKSAKVKMDKVGSNFLDALSKGTTDGLKLAVNVAAMLLVFIAFITLVNGILGWLGDISSLNTIIFEQTGYEALSLEFILGYALAPLMWLIGVDADDISMMGQLLGIKIVASEFVAYVNLAELKNTANALHLNHFKSVIMATYMLCGFANFASIGIQIGGIGSLAPSKRKTLSKLGFKALIGGTLASLLSATIAGVLVG